MIRRGVAREIRESTKALSPAARRAVQSFIGMPPRRAYLALDGINFRHNTTRGRFDAVLTEAVADLAEHGFDSIERVDYWTARLREAAIAAMEPPHVVEQLLGDAMAKIYGKMVERGQIAGYHRGVGRFTLEHVSPQLRAELERRIVASAGLIKLNRNAAVEKTMQRFSGWATSVPAGGSEALDRRKVKTDIRKPMTQLPFEERRVLIDQGHKLRASLSETLARGGQAIAMVWHSHWRQSGYNYRPDHKERDGKCYLLRGNWAQEQGIVKAGKPGYYDDITACGEEVFCRCYATWVYALRDLPPDMITEKGRSELERVRAMVGA